MAKTPIPFMPFSVWRWLFMKMARQNWDQQAASNQVSKEDVLAKPYVDIETANTPHKNPDKTGQARTNRPGIFTYYLVDIS